MLLFFTFLGFCIWAASDLPLALRELTINSRPANRRGSVYALLKTLAVLIKIWAALTWLIGLVVSFLLAVYLFDPTQFISMFSAFS